MPMFSVSLLTRVLKFLFLFATRCSCSAPEQPEVHNHVSCLPGSITGQEAKTSLNPASLSKPSFFWTLVQNGWERFRRLGRSHQGFLFVKLHVSIFLTLALVPDIDVSGTVHFLIHHMSPWLHCMKKALHRNERREWDQVRNSSSPGETWWLPKRKVVMSGRI